MFPCLKPEWCHLNNSNFLDFWNVKFAKKQTEDFCYPPSPCHPYRFLVFMCYNIYGTCHCIVYQPFATIFTKQTKRVLVGVFPTYGNYSGCHHRGFSKQLLHPLNSFSNRNPW